MDEDVTENAVEQVAEIATETLFAPQRLQDESFENYKERRLIAQYKLHQMAKGKLVWNSRPVPNEKGQTYRKLG